jgi:hypothetical protein
VSRLASARAAALLAFAFAFVPASGCGGGEAPEAPAPEEIAAAPDGPSAETSAPPLYDPDGHLLPSTTKVAGLTLPRGLEPSRSTDGEHVFRSEVPLQKVLAYFGPRLFTARVDRIGGGAVYRHARPTEARGGAVDLDVSILPTSEGHTRIHIYELAAPPIRGAEEVTPGFGRLD